MKETALGVIAFLAGGAVAGALWLTGVAAVEVHRAIRAERAKHRARRNRNRKARPGRNYTQAWPPARPRIGDE
jgi:hypothetical protein